jgi:hypothetical protein
MKPSVKEAVVPGLGVCRMKQRNYKECLGNELHLAVGMALRASASVPSRGGVSFCASGCQLAVDLVQSRPRTDGLAGAL